MACGCSGKSGARRAAKINEVKTEGAWRVDFPDGTVAYFDVKVSAQAAVFRAGSGEVVRNK